MEIPVSADERLEKEQQMVVEFRYRKAERSKEKRILQIKTIMTIRKDSKKSTLKRLSTIR